MTVSLVNTPIVRKASNRAHRIDVHRHADAYLENLEKLSQTEKLNKAEYKPGIAINYVKSLAKGLETMFKAFHI